MGVVSLTGNQPPFDEWLGPAATETPEQCVAAVRKQFDLGCDGVILHGVTPAELVAAGESAVV